MRKGMWSAAALVGLLSGVSVLLIGPAVRAADTKVAMAPNDELIFEPADITVPVGGTVVWHNAGNIQHDAKADNGSFSIPLVDPGKDSKAVAFTTPGDITYFCTVPGHKSAGMVGTIHVGAPSTPTTGAPTTTTQAASGGATTTTAAGATTTTTAKGADGAATTTTAAGAAGATTTTVPQAQSVTPTSAPEAGETSSTETQGGEQAAEGHASEGGSHKGDKSSPIGIAFAAVSTLLLGGIAGKLLLSKP